MDLEQIRERAARALAPIKPAGRDTAAPNDMLFSAVRAVSGSHLPPYYFVYFLMIDLLGFKNLGQFEKVSWSIPIDYNGRAFLIEHRKFGVGVFSQDTEQDKASAQEIAQRIVKAAKLAQPYFDWRAEDAAKRSHLNVRNQSDMLFERFEFFAKLYQQRLEEAEQRKDEQIRTEYEHGFSIRYPVFELRKEAKWFALATIESFFSWTEHVFILIAILQGKITTGELVSSLAAAEWDTKFKAVFDLTEPETKRLYDGLRQIRTQLRNAVAHGSFGKAGEALQFHSGAGAVPMLLPHNQQNRFRFGEGVSFVDHEAIELLWAFIGHLWSGPRAPAKIYVQDFALPLILTMTQTGEYAAAMSSVAEMEGFTRHLAEQIDRSANMDF